MNKVQLTVALSIVVAMTGLGLLYAEDGPKRDGPGPDDLRAQARELRYSAERLQQRGREGEARELLEKANTLEAQANKLAEVRAKEGEFRKEGDKRREGDVRKEGEKPREGEFRKDGEKPREGEFRKDGDKPREGEFRKDGDKPREGEFRKDGDKPREGEFRKDGDKPREGAFRKDGDKPREGELRKDGEKPREGEFHKEVGKPREGGDSRVNPEVEARARELMGRLEQAKREGRADEAEKIARQLTELKEHLKREQATREGARREGDGPGPNAELEARARELSGRLEEAKRAGRADEAEKIARQLTEIKEHFRREQAAREGGDRRPDERDGADVERRIKHVLQAAENLEAAGLPDQARAMRQQAEQMKRGFAEGRRPEGDRRPEPRPDGERRFEGDRGPEAREVGDAVQSLRNEIAELRRSMQELREQNARREREGR